MKRGNKTKKPAAFWVIMAIALAISVAVALLLPATLSLQLKIIIVFMGTIILSFIGIAVYVAISKKKVRRR